MPSRLTRPSSHTGLALAVSFCVPALAPSAGRAGSVAPPAPLAPAVQGDGRLSFSLETAYLFYSIPSPFFSLVGQSYENPYGYELTTQIASARYRLTGTGGPGPFRGNLEGSAGFLYSAILQGPETFYAGYLMGLRYTFVSSSFPVQPYVEVRGGIGWTDSQGSPRDLRYAQQEDLAFTYLLGAGVRYDFAPRWSATLGALDQHLSNFYLAKPNFGFDTVGVQLGLTRQF